nr:MAG TPA: hypothetical protein [Caudoviricetes sp.]
MTQSSKKFKQTVKQVFANVNHVMQMCHEDVAIASMDEQTYTYSFGDKHVTVTACVAYDDFEYVPRFTVAKLGSDDVEELTVYSAGYMECAYVYAAICQTL